MQYEVLSPFLPKYPKAAGSLFQTYNDLKYGVSEHHCFQSSTLIRTKHNNGPILSLLISPDVSDALYEAGAHKQ